MNDIEQGVETSIGNGDPAQFVDGSTTDSKPAVNVDVTKDDPASKEATSFPYEQTILDLISRVGRLERDNIALKATLARRGIKC